MNKAAIETVVTEAINFLASKYETTAAEVVKGLEAGHLNLTEAFSSLVKTGLEVAI